MTAAVPIPIADLEKLCQKWNVQELSLFGSVLREDFGPESDVDVAVRFKADDCWSLLDLMAMKEELEQIFGRPVDLVETDAIKNPFRRRDVMKTKQVVYAA